MDALSGGKWNARNAAVFICAAALFVVDRALKYGVTGMTLGRGDAAVRFAMFKNPGIAFSLPLSSEFFWPAAVIIFIVLLWAFWKALAADRMKAGIFLLIILGALSNLIDRAAYGATIDYLIFFNISAVNIADGMIIAGLLALIFGRAKSGDAPTS